MNRSAAERAVRAACRPALPLPLDTLTGNDLIFSGPCLWRGWALTNKNASSGDIELYDGLDNTGTPIAYSHQASGGSISLALPDAGMYCVTGLFVVLAVTPWRGSIFYTPLDDHELDGDYDHGEHAYMSLGRG